MNKTLVTFVALLALGNLALAADKPTEAAAAPKVDPQAEIMAKMVEYSTPNDNHKALEALTGKWDYTLKVWMEPSSKPESMSGSSDNNIILGGRYLQQTATAPATDKMPAFEGMGLTGYDNLKKEYTSIWVDNMGTGMMNAIASFDAKKKTFNEKGSMSCPMTGEAHRHFRGAIKINDKDHYTYSMWQNDKSGKEYLGMEISYKRAK